MATALPYLVLLAALYVGAAYALRPPRFVAWPGQRYVGEDLSLFRLMHADRMRGLADTFLRWEKERSAALREQVRYRDARIVGLTEERDVAEIRAFAAVRLSEADALLIAGQIRERDEDGREGGAEGAASAALPPPVR